MVNKKIKTNQEYQILADMVLEKIDRPVLCMERIVTQELHLILSIRNASISYKGIVLISQKQFYLARKRFHIIPAFEYDRWLNELKTKHISWITGYGKRSPCLSFYRG